MKINNFFFLLLLATTFSLTFISCGGDSDDDDNSSTSGASASVDLSKLEGTWEFVDGYETVSGSAVPQPMGINMTRQQVEQLANQMHISLLDATLTFSGNKVNGSEYKMQGNVLMSYADQELSATIAIASLTNTDMTLHEVFDLKEEGMNIDANLHYKKK